MKAANRLNLAFVAGDKPEDFAAQVLQGTNCVVAKNQLIVTIEDGDAAPSGKDKAQVAEVYKSLPPTEFIGRETLEAPVRIVKVSSDAGRTELVFDRTPFYAESGGQVGDTGVLLAPETGERVAIVENTYKPAPNAMVHLVRGIGDTQSGVESGSSCVQVECPPIPLAPHPFASIQDLVDRVPTIRKDELRALAEVGALNFINGIHRRDALWQAELAMRPAGPLFAAERTDVPEPGPLAQMTDSERLNTDFRRTHLTIGRHPMAFHRDRMNELGVVPASELRSVPHGRRVRTAGCVICRQRPGTAKGLVFLSVEDETGVSNGVIMPDVYAEYRATLLETAYLLIEGELQNIDNVVTVKVSHMIPLHVAEEAVPSHDFR